MNNLLIFHDFKADKCNGILSLAVFSFYGFPLLSYVVCFSLGLSLFEPYFSFITNQLQSLNWVTGVMPDSSQFSIGPSKLPKMQIQPASRDSQGNFNYRTNLVLRLNLWQMLLGINQYTVISLTNKSVKGPSSTQITESWPENFVWTSKNCLWSIQIYFS